MSPSPILLGIDLGGTKIEIIALDSLGQTLYRSRKPTPKADLDLASSSNHNQYSQILQTIHALVIECESQLKQTMLPVGIGIPGAICQSTGLVKNANTTCLIGKDFNADLSKQLSRPIKIENDANCFALSEAVDGSGQGMACIFAVIIGTGVGGGWVINQKLHIGANAIGGEWGHNSLAWHSEKDEPKQACYCGKQGCIETYLSGPGFSKQTELQFDLIKSSQEIVELKDTNHAANLSYQLYVDRLARSLASVINIMDPDVIILGGGLSNIESLYKDIPKVWGQYIFSDTINTQLVKNTFGDSSGVRGAAWLNCTTTNKGPQ